MEFDDAVKKMHREYAEKRIPKLKKERKKLNDYIELIRMELMDKEDLLQDKIEQLRKLDEEIEWESDKLKDNK